MVALNIYRDSICGQVETEQRDMQAPLLLECIQVKLDGPTALNSRCFRIEDTWLRQP